MSNITLRLVGTLTAVSPIATCPPDCKGTDNVSYIPRFGGKPYFPGSGLRGTLRRRALDAILSILSPDGGPILSLEDYNLNAIGGVKGDGAEDTPNIGRLAAIRAKNPLIALFGANTPWTAGKLLVGHARVTEPRGSRRGDYVPFTDVVTGVRTDDFKRTRDKLMLLTEDERDRWEETDSANALRAKLTRDADALEAKLKDKKAPIADAEVKATMVKELADLREKAKAAAAKAVSSVSTQLLLAGYEVLPPDTEMESSITIERANEIEAGLFVAALRRWAIDPVVGAHKSHGCGLMSAKWTVMRLEGDQFVNDGEVTVTPYEGVAVTGKLAECEKAFRAALTDTPEAFDFTAKNGAATDKPTRGKKAA